MTEQHPLSPPDTHQSSTDDDLEAHGLREVAAAAGIGAAVLGAGGAMTTAAAHGPGPAGPPPPPGVNQTVSGARHLASDVTTGTEAVAQRAAKDTTTLLTPTVDQVDYVAGRALGTAGEAARLAERTLAGARSVTVTAANETAGYATSTASSKATYAVDTTMTVINAVRDRSGEGWTLGMSVLGVKAGTSGGVAAPSGTISVVDGHGTTVATAEVADGTATVHISAVGLGTSYSLRYLGAPGFAPVTVHWLPPAR